MLHSSYTPIFRVPPAGLLLAVLLLPTSPALAQQPPADTPAPTTQASPQSQPIPGVPSQSTPWSVEINPRLWWVSPSGKLKLPASSPAAATNGDSVHLENLNLDTPRFSPYGEATINADPFRLTLSGASFSLDRSSTAADSSFTIGDTPVSRGDPLGVSFDFATFEADAAIRLYRRDFKLHTESPGERFDALLSVYAVGGLRLYDTDISVHNLRPGLAAPTSASSEQIFVEPILGLRAQAQLAKNFDINLQVTGGGMFDSDRSSHSIDVAVSFVWRPDPAVGLQIGWRQVAFWLADGDAPRQFDYNGRLAGLFAGIEIRF